MKCLLMTTNTRSIADELVAEKEKYKAISEDLDLTVAELSGY